MSTSAQIQISVLAHEATTGDLHSTMRVTPANYSLVLENSAGTVVWSDSGSVGANSTVNIDLANLTDDRGTVAFTSVRFVYIKNIGTGALTIAAAGSNPWAGTPAGLPLTVFASAYSNQAVSAGSKVIAITSTTASQYEIIVIGQGAIT
jgi:hypothetical protein